MMDTIRWSVETGVWIYEGYQWTLTFADKRVENWMLMGSPVYTAYWALAYLTMVWLGPKMMRRLPAFQLRPWLILYNLAITLLNFYIFVELLYVSYMANYSYNCQPVVHSMDPWEYRMAAVLWWFYFSKLLEFADTLFFILRKKDNQLTFLHVYHHTTMLCFWWIGIKWVAGGSSFLGAMMNSFVHTLMYLYYFLTAAAPGINVWWKKYLTVLQLIQFMIAIVQTVRGLWVDCPFPRWMGYTLICYMCSFILLFSNFFLHTYIKKKSAAKKKRLADAKNNGEERESDEKSNQKYQQMLSKAKDENGDIDWDKTKTIMKKIWDEEKEKDKKQAKKRTNNTIETQTNNNGNEDTSTTRRRVMKRRSRGNRGSGDGSSEDENSRLDK